MKIKIIQNKEIRVWKYPSHNKYQSLLAFIAKTFGYFNPSSYSLQYQDDEGDNINITNDSDIDDALLFATEERRKSLKIYLISSTAMDDFLNDALGDIFAPSASASAPHPIHHHHHHIPFQPPKPKPVVNFKSSPKRQHKIHKQQPNISDLARRIPPNQSHVHTHALSPKQMLDMIPSKPPHTKPMNPEDILASMFEEDIASQSSHASIPSAKPPIMSDDVQNILDSMAFTVEPTHEIHASKPISNAKPMIHSQVEYPPPPPVPNHTIVPDPESSDDLLHNLLNDSDVARVPIMDPQDVINSIVNKRNTTPPKQNTIVVSDESEQEERVEESVSELKLDDTQPMHSVPVPSIPTIPSMHIPNNNNNNNGTEPFQPPEILQPKKVQPYYGAPTIQTSVPPAPFLQPTPARRNMVNGTTEDEEQMQPNVSNGHEAMHRDENEEEEEEKESDVLRLLQQFNDLPDVPAHVVSAQDIGGDVNDEQDAEDEEEADEPEEVAPEEEEPQIQEPDAKTLEEIKKSLVHPMSFHDTNLEQIKADMKRETLPDTVDEEAEDMEIEEEHKGDTEPDEDDDEMEQEEEDMEIEPISNGDEATEETNNADEATEETHTDVPNGNNMNDNDEKNNTMHDEADVTENQDGNKYQNEIDRLYAELDDIDMDFEINRIQSLNGEELETNTPPQEDEAPPHVQEPNDDIQIVTNEEDEPQHNNNNNNDEKDAVHDEDGMNGIAHLVISPMDRNLVNENMDLSPVNGDADKVASDEIEAEPEESAAHPYNPSNEIEAESSQSSDDEDMDLTRTTPDPVHTEVPSDEEDGGGGRPGEASIDLQHEVRVTEAIKESTEHDENIQNNNNDNNNNKKKPNSDPSSHGSDVSSPIVSSAELMMSPRDQRREIARILREEQREQQKKQKLQERQERMALKKKDAELRKIEKEKQRQKRLELKESLKTSKKTSKKYEKLRRTRIKELNQFRAITDTQQSEIFSPNKNWYPIKFVVDTKQIQFEFETVQDLIQIIELQCVKQYRICPSFIECVSNADNIHCAPQHMKQPLPSDTHRMVYIYYNWRSALNVKFQSINLGLRDAYISKVNVFRIPPWMNTKMVMPQCINNNNEKNESEMQIQINPNEVYNKLLMESELAIKHKSQSSSSKSSPLSLLKKFKSTKSVKKEVSPSAAAALLPENCEQTPNFRWKFDLTQDYSAFDPLLNDEVLLNAMHEFEIYFVQIRNGAVINELPRVYDIFVVYLNCGTEEEENSELRLSLLKYFGDQQDAIVAEILSYLRYDRCYGFVTVARNTCVDIHHPNTEQITFHVGSIADWIPCAIVGETSFDDDLLRLQKHAKWDNKQHISLSAFLNSIVTTYTM